MRGVRPENLQRRGDPEPHAAARRGEEHRRLQRRAVARDRGHAGHAGGEVRVVNGYFVNGQAPGSEKFEYKMNWLRAPARLACARSWRRIRSWCCWATSTSRPKTAMSCDPVGLRDTIHHTDRGARPLPRAARAGPGRRLPAVRAAREKLQLVGLPRCSATEEPRPAHRPHPGQRGAASPRCRAASSTGCRARTKRPSDHAPVVDRTAVTTSFNS